jgi:hypothetical protein
VLNRNIHSRSAQDSAEFGYSDDLTAAPGAALMPDPADNSLAMLGQTPEDETGGAMLPSEAGPTGTALAAMGMMVQGAQMLSTQLPGFVPQEITMWLQQGMQILPQLIQQMQSGMQGMPPGGPGAMMGGGMMGGDMGGQTAALGPAQQPPGSSPSGPPRFM